MRSTHRHTPLMYLLALAASISVATIAQAAVLVSDGFDYSPPGSSLASASGGSGFTAPWIATGLPLVAGQGLSHPLIPNSSGLAFSAASNTTAAIKRSVDTSVFPASLTNSGSTFGTTSATGTLWISYLHQLNNAYSYFTFESIRIGTPSASSPYYSVTTHTGGGTYTLSPNAINLIIIRLVFNASGIDQLTLWVNPASLDLSLANAVDSYNVNLTPFNQFQFANIAGGTPGIGGSATFDEFRIATDLASVIPEPAGLALITSLLLLCIRPRTSTGHPATH